MAKIYWPFSTSLVSEWPGSRPAGWAHHLGTDFAVAQGTPLRATASGHVDVIWNDGLGAWVIDIHTPDGFVVRHAHLSKMTPRDGQWVDAGQVIGATGGRPGSLGAGLSTGPHLHWEIRNNSGWGANGWYDPRNMTILSFSSLDKPKKPATSTGNGASEMLMIALPKGAPDKKDTLFAAFGPNFWLEFTGQSAANNFNKQLSGTGAPALVVSKTFWDSCKKAAKTGSNR